MTPAEAARIADEHIAWARRCKGGNRPTAWGTWCAISPDRYPGGGWERVRGLMIGWLLFDAEEMMADEFEKATPRPWFVHDFTGAIDGTPVSSDVTISCDHPASITVATMGRGLTARLEEARANARLIVAAVNERDALREAQQERDRCRDAKALEVEWRHKAEAERDALQQRNAELVEALVEAEAMLHQHRYRSAKIDAALALARGETP